MAENVLVKLKQAIVPQSMLEKKQELFFIFNTLKEKGKITNEDYDACINEIRIRYR